MDDVRLYDSHTAYVKQGECRHCGRCCLQNCPSLLLTAMREIRPGEEVQLGVHKGMIRSHCLAWGTDENVNGCTRSAREGFPFSPWSTPEHCGFYWVPLTSPLEEVGSSGN